MLKIIIEESIQVKHLENVVQKAIESVLLLPQHAKEKMTNKSDDVATILKRHLK